MELFLKIKDMLVPLQSHKDQISDGKDSKMLLTDLLTFSLHKGWPYERVKGGLPS